MKTIEELRKLSNEELIEIGPELTPLIAGQLYRERGLIKESRREYTECIDSLIKSIPNNLDNELGILEECQRIADLSKCSDIIKKTAIKRIEYFDKIGYKSEALHISQQHDIVDLINKYSK